MTSRYDGKPLLRLLEYYVLRAIGELGGPDEEKLRQMAPKLRAIYGAEGEWHEVIASAMALPADLPETLHDLWSRNLEIARERGEPLPPQRFAEMIVDQNFAPQGGSAA